MGTYVVYSDKDNTYEPASRLVEDGCKLEIDASIVRKCKACTYDIPSTRFCNSLVPSWSGPCAALQMSLALITYFLARALSLLMMLSHTSLG